MYLLFPKWALRGMFDGLTQAIPEQSLSTADTSEPSWFSLSGAPVF